MFILYGIAALFLALLVIVTWAVTLSSAIAWYEYANRDPQLLTARFLPERRWLALRLIVLEIYSIVLAVGAYPFGLLPQRPVLFRRAPLRPILLLHGLFHNRAVWFLVKQRLEQCGYTVFTINLPPWHSFDTLTRRVSETVEEICVEYDVDKIDLVGHSLGGLLARYYLQYGEGKRRIGRCLFLGAPQHGSKLAPFALSPLGQDLFPGSDFLRELEAEALPEGPRYISIYSHHDNIVIPSSSCRLDIGESVELEWLGHTSLLFHKEGIDAIVAALRSE